MVKPFPLISEELIEALASRFPDRLPRKLTTVEEVHRLMGNQEVIDCLRAEHIRQQNRAKR